ncbi:MAG: AmmeMemoRadiSam system protein A [Holophagaceae bacterium]|nr:AmmeMemoRadiSam system protein A [Holophagaceae bacterium]
MDTLVQLAQCAIESFVKTGQENIPDSLRNSVHGNSAGVFVSIHTKSGDLRGCIGTIFPSRQSLADEIVQNAVWACSRDHRFNPVAEAELISLVVKVDVLSQPEQIDSQDELDPSKYGVIVSTSNGRKGLLLPALDGIDTVEEQINICRRKGGIGFNEPVALQRFTVDRHE